MSEATQGREEDWSLVIQPKRGWLDIDLREL